MQPQLEGPWNIPSDIGCVWGLELAAKTSEPFFGRSHPAVSKMGEATPLKQIARTHCSLLQ